MLGAASNPRLASPALEGSLLAQGHTTIGLRNSPRGFRRRLSNFHVLVVETGPPTLPRYS